VRSDSANPFRARVVRGIEGITEDIEMINPKLLRNIAVYGVSLPTFAASPAVAKATVYMPSHVAARMLGGRAAKHVIAQPIEVQQPKSSEDTSHAA
jgi:hypothetical protein